MHEITEVLRKHQQLHESQGRTNDNFIKMVELLDAQTRQLTATIIQLLKRVEELENAIRN